MLNVKQVLQEATHYQHKQLDSHRLYRQLFLPTLSTDIYAQILQNFYQWHVLMQSRLVGLDADQFPFIQEPILSRLQLDFQNMGTFFKHRMHEIPVQNHYSYAYQLGALYVVQGASMGGQIIAPKVEKLLQRQDVTNYFRGARARTAELWQQTLQHLEQALDNPLLIEQAVQGAQESFLLMMEVTHLNEEAA